MSQKFNQNHADISCQIRKGLVPRIECASERPTNSKDFEDHLSTSIEALNVAVLYCESSRLQDLSQDSTLQKQILVPLLILSFENMSKALWNNGNHIRLSYKILSLLKSKIFLCEILCEALVSFENSDKLLRWCLEELRPKLENKLWIQYPGAQQAFVVLLNQISLPGMGKYASEFLPFSLQFVDHWDLPHITTGTLCLQHIVNELTPAELKWFGRKELILNALTMLMHVKEPVFHDILFTTIFKTISKTVGPKNSCERYASLDDWDSVFQKFLLSMSIETCPDAKESYAKHIRPFVLGLRVGIVRWLSKVFAISEAYLAVPKSGEETRLSILEMMKMVLYFSRPRLHKYSRDLFEQLLRLLYESSNDKFDCLELKLSTRDTFLYLVEISPGHFLSLCKGLNKTRVNTFFDETIQQGFNVANDVLNGANPDFSMSNKMEELVKEASLLHIEK